MPPQPAYEPLVDPSIYGQVQQEFAAKRHARSANPERGLRAYVFRGLLRCGVCNRLMQGAWNNDEAYYRCRIPEEYATANRISHPRNVYLRERRLQPALDGWLTATCAPARLVQLVRAGRHPLGEAHAGLTAALSRSVRGLREASPSERADTYAALKLRLVYYPPQQLVRAKIALGPREVPVRGLIDLKRTAGRTSRPARPAPSERCAAGWRSPGSARCRASGSGSRSSPPGCAPGAPASPRW